MPSTNIVLYPVFETVKYRIQIDPNGGVMDHINYDTYGSSLAGTGLETNTGYNQSFATYFNSTAEESISVNDDIKRPYVQISDAEAATMEEGTVYRYLNMQYMPQYGSYAADARNAVYIKDTEESIDAYYNYYRQVIADTNDGTPLPRSLWESLYLSDTKYREPREGESYKLVGWYEVLEDGTLAEEQFDFSKPIEKDTKLRAIWRLDGSYTLQYTTEYYAPNGDFITANMEGWSDPGANGHKYTDQAATQAMQEPTEILVNGEPSDEYQFRGWQIVSVTMVNGKPRYTALEPGVYYTAGQPLTVQAMYSDDDMVIHMQAVYEKREDAYRRPEIINLTLDASKDADNVGTGSVDLTNGEWPTWSWPGHYYNDDSHIYFGDTQSNTAVHLYQYATTLTKSDESGETLDPAGVNFFEHSKGYRLIGFDLDRPDTNYVPDYAADAIVAVSPSDSHTLYAVWEPMVYLTFVNDTEVGDVTFNLSGTGQSMYVVNQANDSFERVPVDTSGSITVKKGETLRLAVPYGEGETITVNGTNTLGTGYMLTAKSELGTTDPIARTLTGTYSRVPNTQEFNFSDSLVKDPEGVVITFKAEKAPHTLILQDNYNGDGTGGGSKEATFSESTNGIVYDQTEDKTSYTLPSTSTRIGYELLGWDTDPAASDPTYKTGAWDITDLTDFFTGENSSSADIEVKTLYAIWKANADSSTIYVWKDVPNPGDQSKDFVFTVKFGGDFIYTESESYTSWFSTKYRWKGSPSSGTIAANTARNGDAVLTHDFELSHNQYLKIVTVQNQTNGTYPYLTMTVSKWQRNDDGTPDTRLDADSDTIGMQDETVLYWYWRNETITDDTPTATGQYKSFQFKNLSMSVTENDYTSQYDLGIDVAAETNARLAPNETARTVTWDDTFAGGTAIYTNTRKTADVTVKKTLLPDTLSAENFNFTASLENGEGYVLEPASKAILSGTGEWKIEGIPTGAVLTLTEEADKAKYDTSVQSTVSGGTFDSEAKSYSMTVEEDTTVTFTNTLKKQYVKFVLVDDSEPAEPVDSATFNLPGVFTGEYAKDAAGETPGEIWEGWIYAGDYTLTEIIPNRYYESLHSLAVITVGDAVTAATQTPDSVTVTGGSGTEEDPYVVTIVNPKKAAVTVQKLVTGTHTEGSFAFIATLSDDDTPVATGNVIGTTGTDENGQIHFYLSHNHAQTLYVPKGLKLEIIEAADKYSTVTAGAGVTDADGSDENQSFLIDSVNADGTVTFTNTRINVIQLKKVDDSTPAHDLPGSKFTLSRKNSGGAFEAYPITLVDGMYVSGGTQNEIDLTEAASALIKLENGTYSLVESKTPDGYVRLLSEIVFTVQDGQVSLEDMSQDDVSTTNGTGSVDKIIQVVNHPGVALPNTGGHGTTALYLLGLMLTGIAGAGLVMRKRKRA